MKYIGRLINVGFGIEATRGTAVPVQNWQPKTDFSFEDKAEVIQDESSIGVLTDSRDSVVSKKWAEWEYGANVEVNSIGYLLYALLWSVTSAVDTTGAYKHIFELLESNQTPSLTIGVDDPTIGGLQFGLGMIEELTINCEEGQYATFTVTFKAKPGETTTHSVTYIADNKLLSRHSILKVATNVAWLSGATASCIKSFEITFSKNLEDDYCLWSQTPRDFINKQFSIEGSFTATFDDITFRTLQLAWSKRAVSFELTDSGTTIGLTSHPSLKFVLPIVSFTEFSRSMGNDEVVIQTMAFKWLHSMTDGESIEATLINTTEEYVSGS